MMSGRPTTGPALGGVRDRGVWDAGREAALVSDSTVQTGCERRSVALFVMGASRSGTSALTRTLSLCGGVLPAALEAANASNPLGHWEPRKAIDLNDAILYRHRSSVHDPTLRLQEEVSFEANEAEDCIAEIREFLTTLPAAPLVLIKEPRITALSDVWFAAARLAGFEVAAVIAVRHPQEAIASLVARDGASPELSGALWLKYSLLAERHTRALPRVFVHYANLLHDWRHEITRISSTLALDLEARDERAIEEFLQGGLRRQRHLGPVRDYFGTNWMSSVYAVQCAAARDEPWDSSALDCVYESYRANERDLRTAFADFQNRFDFKSEWLRTLFRPSITRRLRAANAVAARLGMDPLRRRYHTGDRVDTSNRAQDVASPES